MPLFALLSAQRLHLGGYPLLAVRIAVTLVVATGSYYLVEEPIRRRRTRTFTEWRAWLVTAGSFVGVVVVTVAATLPSAAEAASPLRVQGAAYGPPVKVLVFGDSVAWRLGFAMLASQPQTTYDVSIDNGAIIGAGCCSPASTCSTAWLIPTCPSAIPRHRSPTSGRLSGRATSTSSNPTWWWCWRGDGRCPTG